MRAAGVGAVAPSGGAAIDPMRRARLLRRIHELGPERAQSSSLLRGVIAESWARSAAAGIDQDAPAPRVLDGDEAAERLEEWPFGCVLPAIATVLARTLRDSRSFAVLSDPSGLILWADGDPVALKAAASAQFVPGAMCSESTIGTNAVGTAIALGHPVQVFSAEHFNRLLHSWTCVAAPFHDPSTGDTLGVIDISGDFRGRHPHSLGLVTAVARMAEAELARDQSRQDQRLKELYVRRVGRRAGIDSALLDRGGRVIATGSGAWLGGQARIDVASPHPTLANGTAVEIEPLGRQEGFVAWSAGVGPPDRRQLRLETLGRARLRAVIDGRVIDFGSRQGRALLLLALHPEGQSAAELGARLYGAAHQSATVRAEISRLRARLGGIVRSEPYRLDALVSIDAEELAEAVCEARDVAALESWRGGPLPGCETAEIAHWRRSLADRLGLA